MLSKFSGILLLTLLMTVLSFGQSKRDETVLAKFDNHTITVGEFEKAYSKDGAGSGDIKKDSLSGLENFMHLYLVYKMKLADAHSRGYDKSPEVVKEIDEYKNQVTKSFFIQKYIINPNLKRLYERRKWEYRISHILFVPKKGKEEETLKLAIAVLDSLEHGADFAKMAARYSDDGYSKNKGGDIYYITGGHLPLYIENAIYSTEPGHIYPKIVKSEYGYHIFKVTEKIKRRPQIRASHILIRPVNDEKKPDSTSQKKLLELAKVKADSIYAKVKAGEDFAKLAEKYSMDTGTAAKGGDIGFFTRNQTVRPFDEAAFNLKKVGDVSGVVETPFGFHIIKLTGIAAYPTFDEDRDDLIKTFKIRQYNEVYIQMIDSLKTRFHFVENKKLADEVAAILDTDKSTIEVAPLPDSIRNSTIFSLDNKRVTIQNYIDKVKSLPNDEYLLISKMPFQAGVSKISGEELLEMAFPEILKNDPAYKQMMNDYQEGATIYKLQQAEIWSKLKLDSTSVFNYFNTHKNKFQWPDRVQFTELFTLSDSLIHHYKDMIEKGANFDTLCTKYTERKGYKERGGHWTFSDKNHNDLYKKAWTMNKVGQYSDIYRNFGGYSIIRLDKKEPARTKTFEEARAEATSDYQEAQMKELETEYQRKLEKKYNPVIYEDQFKKIYKNSK